MIFNSWVYLVYLPIVLALYWALPFRPRMLMLLIANAVFYGWWDWRYLSLIAVSIAIDYVSARRIGRAETDQRRRKLWLLLSVASNLGILCVFKYFNFFAESAVDVLHALGFEANRVVLNVLLPVGISFYTFQSMAYTIDVYRRKMEPLQNLLVFANYVSFFPQLVAGPIERATHLVPQLESPRTRADVQVQDGLFLILWGLYKKVVVADNLARIVQLCLDSQDMTAGSVTVGLLAFAFQIYGDFSGYTDIARGSALLLGVKLCENFRLPYFAISPSDFWTRWHVSLSSWLRDYLYISLGGNRKGSWFTYRNLFLTMLLGGLWHGAAWTFVVWGIYHGVLLIGYRVVFGKTGQPKCGNLLSHAFWMLVMFVFTLIGWAIFRANDMTQLLGFAQALAGGDWSAPAKAFSDTVFLSSGVLVMMIVQEWRKDMMVAFRAPVLIRIPLAILLLGSLIILGSTGGQEFIYFQF